MSFLRKVRGGTSTEDAKFIFPAVSDTSDIRKDQVIGRVSVDMDRRGSIYIVIGHALRFLS